MTTGDEESQTSGAAIPTIGTILLAVRQISQSCVPGLLSATAADSVGEENAVAGSGAVCTSGCTTTCKNSNSASQVLVFFTEVFSGKVSMPELLDSSNLDSLKGNQFAGIL